VLAYPSHVRLNSLLPLLGTRSLVEDFEDAKTPGPVGVPLRRCRVCGEEPVRQELPHDREGFLPRLRGECVEVMTDDLTVDALGDRSSVASEPSGNHGRESSLSCSSRRFVGKLGDEDGLFCLPLRFGHADKLRDDALWRADEKTQEVLGWNGERRARESAHIGRR
jgi:hypothetical protein